MVHLINLVLAMQLLVRILGALTVIVIVCMTLCVLRELEARLDKQRATREYVQEFLKKKEEVSRTRSTCVLSLVSDM
jgi:hypothetical protein